MYLKCVVLYVFCELLGVSGKLDQFYFNTYGVEDAFDNLLVQPKRLFEDVTKVGRTKRSTDEVKFEEQMRVKLFSPTVMSLEIEDWILLLEENSFLSYGSNFHETWISNDINQKNDETVDCKFYKGIVLHDSDSKAIMTICSNKYYYGFFTAGGKSFFIEPTNHPVDGHIVYKSKPSEETVHIKSKKTYNNTVNKNIKSKTKRCVDCEVDERFNLTGDVITDGINYDFSDENENIKENANEDLNKKIDETKPEEPPKEKVKRYRKYDEDEVGYFADVAWETRPYPTKSGEGTKPDNQKERWLELALAVDYTVINFHGKEKIKQYIMALMNIVSVIYKDPSLDANLHLVIARLIFYDDKKDSQIKEGNAKKSLEAVNRWNYKLIGKLPPDEKPHDVAVWLTREYLGGPSGYAPVAGVCDRARSTALNKDEGLASAFIIAHEVAHILGLTHDGDLKVGNNCTENVQLGTIMAPTVTATFHRFAWSPCSKKEFHKIIKRWTCLLNPPKGKNHVVLDSEITHTFTMDEQCRMEYGDGYFSCKSLPLIESCTHLWCGHENSSIYCITKKGPPVEGTECGFDKWCMDGYCQSLDSRLAPKKAPPKPGGWSSWSSWSECSRTCGYGSQRRTRQCNNPEPDSGGADCIGESEELKICKTNKNCWESLSSDVRANMCSELSADKEYNAWLPYDTDEDDLKCHVTCVFWDTGKVIQTGEMVPDGIPCNYDNHHHVCFKGKCLKLGCDGSENSTLTDDKCGECNGNGRSCDTSNMVFRKILKKDMTRLMVLRRLSRGVSVKISLPSTESNQILVDSSFHLVIKDKNKKMYRMMSKDSDPSLESPKIGLEPSNMIKIADVTSVVLGGALLRTSRSPGTLTLRTSGPLDTDIVVLISAPVEYLQTVEVGVQLNYTLPFNTYGLNPIASGRYTWIKGECFCNGRPKEPICIDTLSNNMTVDSSYCSSAIKEKYINTDCKVKECGFHWIIGKWEHCSATCGENGISHRQLYCVPSSIDNTIIIEKPWLHMVPPNRCIDEKPTQIKSCNVKPCPAHWIEEPWSPCSATCGPGISVRPLRCTAGNNDMDACGNQPVSRWRSCNVNCGNRHKCNRDRSPYCAVKLVSRYCIIPEFQRLCCESCLRYHRG